VSGVNTFEKIVLFCARAAHDRYGVEYINTDAGAEAELWRRIELTLHNMSRRILIEMEHAGYQ